MKQLKWRVLTRMNLLIASLIAFLGIGGCKHQKAVVQPAASDEISEPAEPERPIMLKYGVPRAGYNVNGTVVNSNGEPEQRKVLISTRSDMENALEVETDADGRFSTHFDGFPADSMYFKVEGVDQVAQPIVYGEEGDGFNRGETLTSVVITVPADPNNGRILVKYGVPPRVR